MLNRVEILDKNDCVIRTSKNLRCLISHMYKNAVKCVGVCNYKNGNALLSVFFANGDACHTTFASGDVLLDFIRGRRGMQGAELEIDNINCGIVSRKNPSLFWK